MDGIFVGMIKSGTSLVRRLLGSHPEVLSGLETYWFDFYDNEEGRKYPKGALISDKSLITDEENLEKLSVFNLNHSECLKIYKSNTRPLDFLVEFFSQVVSTNKINSPLKWVEKTPGNALYFNEIVDAGFEYIHVIRDPADVWFSCKRDKKFNTISEFCSVYEKYQMPLFSKHRTKIKLIIYENLARDYSTIINKIFSNVGLYKIQLNDNCGGDSGSENKLVQSISGRRSVTLDRLEDKIDTKSIGVSKSLDPDELALIHEKLARYKTSHLIKTYEDILI